MAKLKRRTSERLERILSAAREIIRNTGSVDQGAAPVSASEQGFLACKKRSHAESPSTSSTRFPGARRKVLGTRAPRSLVDRIRSQDLKGRRRGSESDLCPSVTT